MSARGSSTRVAVRRAARARGDAPQNRSPDGTGREKRRQRPRLVSYDELPEFMRDNEYIRRYYRSEWPVRDALLSAFSWHNETLNVWTHLAGFLLFFWLAVVGYGEATTDSPGFTSFVVKTLDAAPWGRNYSTDNILGTSWTAAVSDGQAVARWPRLVFMVGSMSCLAISAISHLLACHSPSFSLFFWRLDYAGIAIMIVASFVPPICYAFPCNPLARLVYLSVISTLGAATTAILLLPMFTSPRFRPFRSVLFLAMGFSGVVPAVHALWVNWGHPACHVALALEVLMGAAYASGAVIYVTRVPEKWWPGMFDLVGHSHQIFHVLVLVGAITHYVATMVLVHWRDRVALACDLPHQQLGLTL